MSFILLIVGGFLFYASFWLFLHVSDDKVQRYFDSRLNQRLSKSKTEAEGYRVYHVAMTAVLLMVFALFSVVAGIIGLLY